MSLIKKLILGGAMLFCSIAHAAIDINAADANALSSISGIGPAKAEAIIKYREANGAFKSINDLLKVKGIGPKLLDKLRGMVSVGDS